MVTLRVGPSRLEGKIEIPPSKSHTIRAILFGCMGHGVTTLTSYLKSPDTNAMVEAMRLFGVKICVEDDKMTVEGVNGKLAPCENVIDVGNSGQVLRFVGSLAALLPTYTILTGDVSIRHRRPIQPLLSALSQLNATAISTRLDGNAPIVIRGPLTAGKATLSGEDSQPVSGLLIASSFINGATELSVTNPGEKPWIDLTLFWLKRLGGRVFHQNYQQYSIQGPLHYKGFQCAIPGDLSSAAFPLVAALLTKSTLTLHNIDMEDVQGDKKLIYLLIQMGAHLEIDKQNKRLKVCQSPPLKGMVIDVNDMIDAIPILAVVGCFATGHTEIVNGAIARKKESDRLHAITCELRKMGAVIEERPDGLLIKPAPLKGTIVVSHEDHRIAMALAVAALAAEGESFIQSCTCIEKSFPSFETYFKQMGGEMEIHHE